MQGSQTDQDVEDFYSEFEFDEYRLRAALETSRRLGRTAEDLAADVDGFARSAEYSIREVDPLEAVSARIFERAGEQFAQIADTSLRDIIGEARVDTGYSDAQRGRLQDALAGMHPVQARSLAQNPDVGHVLDAAGVDVDTRGDTFESCWDGMTPDNRERLLGMLISTEDPPNGAGLFSPNFLAQCSRFRWGQSLPFVHAIIHTGFARSTGFQEEFLAGDGK